MQNMFLKIYRYLLNIVFDRSSHLVKLTRYIPKKVVLICVRDSYQKLTLTAGIPL